MQRSGENYADNIDMWSEINLYRGVLQNSFTSFLLKSASLFGMLGMYLLVKSSNLLVVQLD